MTKEQRAELSKLAFDEVEWVESGKGECPPDALYAYVDSLIAAEREACAKVCESHMVEKVRYADKFALTIADETVRFCAAAIRARQP